MVSPGRYLRHYRVLLLLLLVLVVMPLLGLYIRGWFLLREFEQVRPVEAATILAENGDVLATLGEGPHEYLSIASIPQHMQDAIIAIEDRWFYEHPGFNPLAMLRALYVNLREGKPVLGASTITQQLAKNLFLTPEKTFRRKVEELVLAIVLEQSYTKKKILELYLNQIYFGEGAYGIEAAARTYFGKSASQLDLAESALLAGLPRSPAAYDPYTNPQPALERRNRVLKRMAALGMISTTSRDKAQATPIRLARRQRGPAPYFVDYVKKQLIDRYGTHLVYKGGLRVHTTLNPSYQRIAQKALAGQKFQGALVAIDPHTGFIRAMVGGRNYIESQFNRAVQAHRQPGSAFKPFVYATAIEQGWRQNTLVDDIPRRYADYEPENWNSEYWGPVTMKHALAYSLNNAAVWTLNQVGIDNVIRKAQAMGITSLTAGDKNLALALGGMTAGVTPVELAGAYVPFANGGIRYDIRAIQRVLDRNGRVLEDHQPRGERVLRETTAFLMTDMMKAVLEYGTARYVNFDRPAAGKTGTTNKKVSVWFVGYTPTLLAAVYVGNDDRKPLPGYGGTLAGPIWARFMSEALADEPAWDFIPPPEITTGVPVHIFSGLLAGKGCQWVETDAFIRGTEPTQYAPCSEATEPEPGPNNTPLPPHTRPGIPDTPNEQAPAPPEPETAAPISPTAQPHTSNLPSSSTIPADQ